MNAESVERAAGRLAGVFARRLRAAGVADPGALADELVVMLRGHGWRPVDALKPPPPPAGSRASGRPELNQALAACQQASERFRAAEVIPERTDP